MFLDTFVECCCCCFDNFVEVGQALDCDIAFDSFDRRSVDKNCNPHGGCCSSAGNFDCIDADDNCLAKAHES